MKQEYKKIITPSKWVFDLYTNYIDKSKIEILPIGINYNKFDDYSKLEKTIDCLLYFKNRSDTELNFIINKLNELKQSYEILRYGNYSEEQFIKLLQKSKYSIVLNNTESQGIAVEEIMSCNLPLFVIDKTIWEYKNAKCSATSVPYWSDECGFKIDNLNDFSKNFNHFLIHLNNYKPRNYILEKLKLEVQAKKHYDM